MSSKLFAGIGSHWTPQVIVVPTQITLVSNWDVQNLGNLAANAYMELEVVRPQFPNPQRLIATLPGDNNFSTEMNRALVLASTARVFSIPAQGVATVGAAVVLARAAVPDGVNLDIRIRVRRVDNPSESADPTKVGPVVTNGQHTQNGVFNIQWEAQLQALTNPTLQGFPG